MPRFLDDIPFASPEAEQVRRILCTIGCTTDDDIVRLGCVGLVAEFERNPSSVMEDSRSNLTIAAFIRENMQGSGCGLPCYVPPTRFCLVHNTIGGLQQGQAARHATWVPNVSRELNSDERKHVAGVQAEIDRSALSEAQEHFGAEQVVEPVETKTVVQPPSVCSIALDSKFCCPEHSRAEPVWNCRFCLAARILNGPLEPRITMMGYEMENSVPVGTPRIFPGCDFAVLNADHIRLVVQVASFTRGYSLDE